MQRPYIESETFKNLTKEKGQIALGEYEDCVFQQCDLSSWKLDHFIFINCEFHECDMSNVTLHETAFQQCTFTECKLMGLHFDVCSNFGLEMHFYKSTLNHSSFHGVNLQRSSFQECDMIDVNMENINAKDGKVIRCNLENAIFHNANLTAADFTESYNFNIDSHDNKIHKIVASQDQLHGFLRSHNIKIV